jgi:transcriptional regulator with XRE-family HTH domain
MPPRENVDQETREHVRAWLWHYKRARGWTNERLADELGMKEPTITNVLNAKRTAGLDLVIAMHRKLHRSADDLLDTFPNDWDPSHASGKGG